MKLMNTKSKRPISLWEARVLQGTVRVQLSAEDLGFVTVGHTVTSAVLPPSRPQPGRIGRMDAHFTGFLGGQCPIARTAAAGISRPSHSVVPSSGKASPLLRSKSPEWHQPGSLCLLLPCPAREKLWGPRRGGFKVSRDFPRTWGWA